jgi:FRG domain
MEDCHGEASGSYLPACQDWRSRCGAFLASVSGHAEPGTGADGQNAGAFCPQREVADMVPTSAPSDVAFWFRGQSNAAWHLEPSFLRSFRHLGESTAAALRLEEDALKAFRSQAHLFVQPFLLEKVKTTACWWALMQHHRAPTRLLDWTVSPYVAAYFAAERGEIEADGAV